MASDIRAGLLRDGNEAFFRDLFDHAGIGMAAFDLSGRVLRSNDAFRRIVGYSEEELRGLDPLVLVHPDDRTRIGEIARDIADGVRDRSRLERRLIRKDGMV